MISYLFKRALMIALVSLCLAPGTNEGDRQFKEVTRFNMAEARQGVAVDQNYIYVIGPRSIANDEKTAVFKNLPGVVSHRNKLFFLRS